MSHKSKRFLKVKSEVKPETYHIDAAIALIKKSCTAKFKETIELCVMLGIDAKKTEQSVRGAVVLPHGSGKTIRIAVFAHGNDAETAKAAGADIVGYEDLADKIKKGELNFDFVIATPDAMKLVGQLGQILGPRGLMPNPKTGSVTTDLTNAIKNAKSGQVKFKTEKNGIIHCLLGKSDFDDIKIKDNMLAILAELKKNRPSAAKGIYFKKIFISSTMGPGIAIDASSVVV